MTKRIWELDAFRGICILGMVAVHFCFDLVELYHFIDAEYPPLFELVKQWGGILFILLSGACVTLGSHPMRRGALVFGFGMACTAVTVGLWLLGMAGEELCIWFGVLHCLGVCMVSWELFGRFGNKVLTVIGTVIALLGLVLMHIRVDVPLLFPLGLMTPSFTSSDYFPLFPHLGFFLLGAVLGRKLYARRTTRFPRVNPRRQPVRFLCACGRHSLWIYLAHQPVLTLIFSAADGIRQALT